VRRKFSGEKLSQAHKKHAYQRLTQAGWSHLKVTNYSIVVNLFLFSLVWFLESIAVSFLVSVVVLYAIMKFVDSKKGFAKQ